MAAMAPPVVPEFLKGLETSITFSREDHPPAVYRPRHAALELSAHIGSYAMSKVFMDRGSGPNIIFAYTLHRMNHSVENLSKSDKTFLGKSSLAKQSYPWVCFNLQSFLACEETFENKRSSLR